MSELKRGSESAASYASRLFAAAHDHGVDLSATEPETKRCSTCGGQLSVVLINPANGLRRVVACPDCPEGRAHAAQIWQRRYAQSALPALYRNMTFETWDALPDAKKARKLLAREAAAAFVEGVYRGNVTGFTLAPLYRKLGARFPLPAEQDAPRASLVLYGPVGTSKTGLVAAALNALMGQVGVLYTSMQAFFERLTSAYGDNPDAKTAVSDYLEALETAPVLALDEWTTERVSEFRRERWNDLLRARFFNQRPTLITTNHTADELRVVWGDRVLEAVEAGAHWIAVGGENLRAKQQIRPEDTP